MSSAPKTNPKAANQPQPAAAPKSEKPKKKKKGTGKRKSRWWVRWSKRLVITTMVARLLLWLFFEQLANFGAGFAGLSVEWRSASLSLSGLSLHIEDLVVRDAEDKDAPPLLTAQDIVADLSMRQLLGGQLSVVDAGIAGARVTVHRQADGTLRLPKAWLEPAAVAIPEPEAEPDDSPLNFELPCWINSARLHDLQFDFVDHSVTPEQHHTAKLDVDVADLGFPDRNGSVMLRMHAPQLCDELFVHTQVQAAATLAKCQFQAAVRGFRPQRFDLPEQILKVLDNAHVVDVRLAGEVDAEVLASAPRQPALRGDLQFGLSLDGIERSTVTADLGPTTTTGTGSEDETLVTPFALTLQVDNLADSVRLEEGRLELSDNGTAVTAGVIVDKLTCNRIAPLLAAAGVTLPECGINLRAGLDADFGDATSIDLARIEIGSADGDDGEKLKFDRCAVRDLRSVDDTLAIGSVEIIGPVLPVRRDGDGAMHIAGLRLTPVAAGDAPSTPVAQPAKPATTPAPIALPKIRLGSFHWSGAQLAYTDTSFEPAAELLVQEVVIDANAITIGEAAPPGHATISFALPNVATKCTADLTIRSRDDGIGAALEVTAGDVTLAALKPWLEPLGIESELTSGTFGTSLSADATFAEDGIHANTQLAQLQFADGDTRWLSIRSLRGDGIVVGHKHIDAGTWSVQDPYVRAHRDAEQVLHAFGLKLGTPAANQTTPATTATAKPTTTAPTQPVQLQHGKVTINSTTLAFSDARYPDRLFSIGLDLTVGADDGTGKVLPIKANLRLDRAVPFCELHADLSRAPERTTLTGTLEAQGIRGEELAMLLPEGTTCTLTQGKFQTAFEAVLQHGVRASVDSSLRNTRLQERDVELFAIDEIVVKVPTITDELVHVADAHVSGVRAMVTLTEDAMHMPGFKVAAAAAPPAAARPPAAPPAEPNKSTPAPASKPTPLQLPKLQIDTLALKLDRFELRDRRGGDAEPLILSTGFELSKPWLGDPDAVEPTPMHFAFTGEVQPLGAQWRADTIISPFDLRPTIAVDFSLTGFDTTQLARVAPELKEQLIGEAKSLSAKARLHAELNLRRRDPAVLDLSRPFGAEVILENLVVTDASSDEPYLSIASIDTIVRAVDARTGSVLVRSITIDEPVVRVEKDAAGTHAFGFLLPPPPPEEGPTEGAPPGEDPPREDTAPQAAAKATTAETPKPPAAAPNGEFAIDRFELLSLRADYRDATTDPPTHLSLQDTDAELKRFSTRAFHEPLPMSFTVAVRGGDVELEERIVRSSVVAGLLTSGANALVGDGNKHEMEQRAMLDEMKVDGQLQLFPKPKGQVNLALNELELAAFRGLAKTAGVDLADGLFDMRVRCNMLGYDGMTVQCQNVFTYLVLDEPPDGPIATYLRLPAPLQTVLFLLRNSDDQQRIPISLRIPADGISQSAITSLAVEALIKLITDATSGVAGRVLSTGTGGLLGSQGEVPAITAELTFAAGSPLPTTADEAAQQNLDEMIAAVRADESLTIVLAHEMGRADQQHAHELANPAADVLDAALDRLEAKHAELEARRPPLAAEVMALYAAGRGHDALLRQDELAKLDRHLGELLEALDHTRNQRGNRNPRESLRRTRVAARALAEARLDAASRQFAAAFPNLSPEDDGRHPRLERRPGRGVPVTAQQGGGRILAVLRRRTASELPREARAPGSGGTHSVRSMDFTPVPPVADPSNRAFNRR